jgi:hypothetical protein
VAGSRETVGAAGTIGVTGRGGATVGAAGTKGVADIGGATIGVSVGRVGVKVGVRAHHIAPGNPPPPVKGIVGTVAGANVAVGQSVMPPGVAAGKVVVKGRVGATRVVSPGTSVVVVGNVAKGGKITARAYDDVKLKIVISNKLMNKCLNGLI